MDLVHNNILLRKSEKTAHFVWHEKLKEYTNGLKIVSIYFGFEDIVRQNQKSCNSGRTERFRTFKLLVS